MLDAKITTERDSMATSADLHIGRRIRGKRRALGLSEESLAAALGVETGRITGYERATERVSSDHLVRLSEILEVPLSYFLPAAPCPGS
ncbi:MAG TPA: helix-turn-helix transcriptional regulator [Acetobacteraceae bacterium]|jgi:transcriptional regulator with XRE-family HTH domain